MKTGNIAIALMAALASIAITPASAAAERPQLTMKPLAAASLDAGSKHVLGYFVGSEGTCRLTLIIVDSPSVEDATPATATTRFVASIEHGKTAYFDTPVSRTLQFACAPDAGTMTVTAVDRTPSPVTQ